MVGATGFEPATSWSQTKCSTRLSYAPIPKRVSIDAPSVPRNDYLTISPDLNRPEFGLNCPCIQNAPLAKWITSLWEKSPGASFARFGRAKS